jgi:glycosyltransferase involved in cell wall biosynthesis
MLDSPAPKGLTPRGVLTIEGWALFPAAATVRVEVHLGEHRLGRARLCVPRPDVHEATGLPLAATAGFALTANLADWPGPDGHAELRAVAFNASGESFELPPVSIVVAPAPEELSDRPARRGVAAPPAQAAHSEGRSLLVFTHQMDLGGAQLYLVDLLSELVATGAARPTVVSAIDGITRVRLEELGIPVVISGIVPVDAGEGHLRRVREIASWAADRDFEAVLVNTATSLSFHGAEVAAMLEVPAVWAIHESLEPAVMWQGVDGDVRRGVEAGLGEAAAAVFESDGTRRLYERHVEPARCLTSVYGMDLRPIDAGRAGFDRRAARIAAGLPPDAEVLLCVGTVEARKAQVPLSLAFEMVAGRHPDAHLVFVGGRGDRDSLLLRDRIAESAYRRRMRLIPVDPDVQTWYGVSDIFVCASDVESLPRTVLEAMAWERPVLATRVFGLPELIDDGRTGWLCEPRDIEALATGIDRALSTGPEERAAVGRAARELVERRCSLEEYGRRIASLLDEVADERPLPISGRVAVD